VNAPNSDLQVDGARLGLPGPVDLLVVSKDPFPPSPALFLHLSFLSLGQLRSTATVVRQPYVLFIFILLLISFLLFALPVRQMQR
jgi:hypothetical protein